MYLYNKHFNFQIDRLLSKCTIKPAVLQSECHPYLSQKKIIRYCKEKGIAFTSYSPLGNPARPWATKSDPVLLKDPKLLAIAEKKKVSTAQLLIRWQVERGVTVIPKSVTPSRIKSNFEVWNFTLNDDEMAQIDAFNRNYRGGVPSIKLDDGTSAYRDRKHPHFSFLEEY